VILQRFLPGTIHKQFDDLCIASYMCVSNDSHTLLLMWLTLSDVGLVPTVQQLSYAEGGGKGH